jgi:hypothetical protein
MTTGILNFHSSQGSGLSISSVLKVGGSALHEGFI